MVPVKSKILLSFLFIVFGNLLYGQPNKKTPLHQFFQNNFDSTIIYYEWSSWYAHPNYYIVAKKDSSIYYFTYKSPYSRVRGRYYPANLHLKFMKEELKFSSTTPDTNRYFLPTYIHYSKRIANWFIINAFNLWKLEETDDTSGGCEIYDDGYDTYYLITANNIKVLNYYAADFYDSCRPKNENRRNEIQTRNAILNIFKE